jgi:class 3 adenylate cyclase/tetratricopeptide (TPR) repeat protein
MRCRVCERENREGALFCRGCGSALPLSCPRCGAPAEPDSDFCDRCGARLGGPEASPREREARAAGPVSYTPRHLAERILKTRAALEGERKHVTVLFADVIDSTRIAGRLGVDDMHALMDRCFALLLDEVHRYEGTVNQFTGDGIMAIFGAPVALEDAPRRAVLAALGIQRALIPLREEIANSKGLDFQMRIGIHSGVVVVGRIGNDLRMDYTAIGDTTHLAARLQAAAPPGAVIVSEATVRQIQGFFETRDLGLLSLKGISPAPRAYQVLGEREGAGRLAALADAGLTPLAGRERELAQLSEAFESARSSRGRVVFLVGEAGIGKSRLLFEFRRRLAPETHYYAEGRCASFGMHTAFLPIVDAIRRFYAIEDRDDEATAIGKLEAGVEAIGEGFLWTLPFLRALLSLPPGDDAVLALDAATRRSETFRALKALTLAAAARRPILFVIEDLHWIDPESEECLTFLSEAVAAARILLVCSHRPGYRHPFGDRSYHERVTIDPLSEAESAELTRGALGAAEVPEAVRRLVASKAEGNPFFLEEVTKSLLEDGTLRLEGGRVLLARDPDTIAVPDRIHDVLMARIDRLAEDPKRAIQIASVIGREFALRLLARIQEVGDKANALVEDLRAVELIYEKAVHPELAYMFKHALTHDVAYASVLVQRRKQLHRTIGLAIEELYADRLAEHYETLAHHFERGEDWARALDYHERSASKAVEVFASRAAAWHCRQALAILDRLGDPAGPERRCALEERLGLVTMYLSEFIASGDAFVRAAEHAVQPARRVANLADASHSYVWGHADEPAVRTADAALSLARAERLADAEAQALAVIGFRKGVLGEVDGYLGKLGAAREIAARTGTVEIQTLVDCFTSEVSEWSGDYATSLASGERALENGRRLRLAHIMIWANWFMGKSACCLGDYGRALRLLEDGCGLTERIGDRAWDTRLLNTLGWCHAEIGNHRQALAYNERAARIAREVGDAEIIANAEINLALNRLALERPEQAQAALAAVAAMPAPAFPFMRWRYSLHLEDALGRVALARREPAEALARAEREREAARRHRAPKLEARALALRAQALAMLERREEALAATDELLSIAERIGYARARWQGLALAAELERRAGRKEQAGRRDAERAQAVQALARSLSAAELRRGLLAAAAAPPL